MASSVACARDVKTTEWASAIATVAGRTVDYTGCVEHDLLYYTEHPRCYDWSYKGSKVKAAEESTIRGRRRGKQDRILVGLLEASQVVMARAVKSHVTPEKAARDDCNSTAKMLLSSSSKMK